MGMTDSVYLASVFRLTAANFRLAAETLAGSMETKENGSPTKVTAIPFYFVASHAAELFLKSALLKRGLSESDLKEYDCRHSLNGLLKALQKKGVLVTSDTASLIDGLHSQHQGHALRYSALVADGKTTFMPPPSLVFAMLDELLLLTRSSTQGISRDDADGS